jgi:hypothetical protein
MTDSNLAMPHPPESGCQSTFIADGWSDLERIFDTTVNCCVLPRELSPALLAASSYLADADVDLAMAIATNDPATVLQLPLPPLPVEDTALRSDLVALVDLLTTLTGATHVGLRLASLHRQMCPRFHVDNVSLRLVCTYQGPGTEWLLEEHTDRLALRRNWDPLNDPDAGLIGNSAEIHHMPRGAIGLLKGERWPGNGGHGVVHRSPSIGAGAPPRLLLSLEPC